jgi:prepilin peptidase CpaA
MEYVLLFFIAISFYLDAKTSRIPNWLTCSGLCIGIVSHIYLEGQKGLVYSLVGMVVGFICMIILYLMGAIGAGDVKLFTAIGSMSGAYVVVSLMSYSIVFAGLIGIFILMYRGLIRQTFHRLSLWFLHFISLGRLNAIRELKQQKNLRFPFMYAVAPAYATIWILDLF